MSPLSNRVWSHLAVLPPPQGLAEDRKHLVVSMFEVFQKLSLRWPCSADKHLWVRHLLTCDLGRWQGAALARGADGPEGQLWPLR